jgi:hypothetical protein
MVKISLCRGVAVAGECSFRSNAADVASRCVRRLPPDRVLFTQQKKNGVRRGWLLVSRRLG